MGKNISAVLELIQFMYENVQYAEFNTKLDYCQVCNYDGEILYNKEKAGIAQIVATPIQIE